MVLFPTIVFSAADLHDRYRPEADIRIFSELVHKANSLTVNTSALTPESGHSTRYLSEINAEGTHLRVERDSVCTTHRNFNIKKRKHRQQKNSNTDADV